MVKQAESKDGKPRRQRDLRLSDAEWKFIAAKAKDAGLTVSGWIRKRILRGMAILNPYHKDL